MSSAPLAPPESLRTIFLSYGHDRHAGLARQLVEDLRRRGHPVWFDESLRTGDDWEHRIEQGLQQAGACLDRGRFVLLMTPHAVRRPDGYCLNELASALRRGLLRYLRPLEFDADFDRHLPRFTGRRWVFEKLDAWLADPHGSRVFWITAAPGVGKTALATWLCANRIHPKGCAWAGTISSLDNHLYLIALKPVELGSARCRDRRPP
jgi:hypothetical protein